MCLGIDLGTSKISIAVYRNDKMEVIKNEFDNVSTPAVVGFSNESIVFGETAVNQGKKNYKNTVTNVLRLVGHGFSDPHIQNNLHVYPFEMEAEQYTDNILICVEYKGEKKKMHPEEILTLLLEHVKDLATKQLKKEVKDCVIVLPTSFNRI